MGAKIEREGSDITLVSFPKMVGSCLEAAEQLQGEGISAEVINLRTIRPFDRETVVNSVKKTHRVISVEEGWPRSGVGAEIISVVTEDCFDELDAPPERITGVDIPMPYAINLEEKALPKTHDIVAS